MKTQSNNLISAIAGGNVGKIEAAQRKGSIIFEHWKCTPEALFKEDSNNRQLSETEFEAYIQQPKRAEHQIAFLSIENLTDEQIKRYNKKSDNEKANKQ